MGRRAPVATLLISTLLALRTLAYANPPDPTWMAGFWDDGDYDDSVILITSTPHLVEHQPTPDLGPVHVLVTGLAQLESGSALAPMLPAHDPRGPPSAYASSARVAAPGAAALDHRRADR